MGEWLRGQSEHCLLAVRGRPTVQLTNQTTVLHAPAGTHSAKPDAFYEMVEALCPAPRYAELFQRKSRPNWDGTAMRYEQGFPTSRLTLPLQRSGSEALRLLKIDQARRRHEQQLRRPERRRAVGRACVTHRRACRRAAAEGGQGERHACGRQHPWRARSIPSHLSSRQQARAVERLRRGQGADALDLVAQCLFNGDLKRAYAWAINWLGGAPARPLPSQRPLPEPAHSHHDDDECSLRAAAAIWRATVAAPGSMTDLYLRDRSIRCAIPPTIRHHPLLAYWDEGQCLLGNIPPSSPRLLTFARAAFLRCTASTSTPRSMLGRS